MLHRALLGLATVLIVARPLVPGDDPGRFDPWSTPANQLLTLFWLVAAVGWTGWNAWSREKPLAIPAVEVGLFLVIGSAFLSAGRAAAYRHPAWLIGWEWVGTLAAFAVVRRLADGPDERGGLLTAMLATGVAASGQWAVARGIESRILNSQVPVPVGFLVLLVPVAVAALIITWRAGGGRVRLVFTGSCLLLLAAGAAAHLGKLSPDVPAWQRTSALVHSHSWLGVGPGNFGRHYPAYLTSAAQDKLAAPRNFALEVLATQGLIGLVALVATVGALFWGIRKALRLRLAAKRDEGPVTAFAVRWEFYIGGMLGLILAFLLRVGDQPTPEAILAEGVAAGVRSVFWVGAFALLEGVPWSDRARSLAGAAGVVLLLLYLSVADGFGNFAVVQPLLVLAAVVLAPVGETTRRPALPFVRLAGFVGAFLILVAYFLAILYPVWRSHSELREARRFEPVWQKAVLPRWREQTAKARDKRDKRRATEAAAKWLKQNILGPLVQAGQHDPGDAVPAVELARWYGELWELDPEVKEAGVRAEAAARWARKVDPRGPESSLAEYRLRLRFARRYPDQAREQFERAAQALRPAVDFDPTDARLRFRLADLLLKAGNSVAGYHQRAKAWELDRQAVRPERRLTDEQRQQLQAPSPPPR